MAETSRTKSNAGMIAALVGIGVGAAFLFSGGSAKAGTPGPTVAEQCKDLEAKVMPVLATATKADIIKLGELMKSAQALGCFALADVIAKKIVALDTIPITPPPKPATQKYTIKSGEGPVEVASKFGVSLDSLLLLNPDLKYGLTGQEVSPFSNAVKGSSFEGTAEGQIDAEGTLNVVAIFEPTLGIVSAGGIDGYPVYASSIRVKGASNNFVYFPSGKAGQPYAAGGPNPSQGRVFATGGIWRFASPWRTGQVINAPYNPSVSGSIAGETLCTSCGHEMSGDVAIGSCCAACSKSKGSCGEQSAEDQISNVVALRQMNKAFGGQEFGIRTFGGAMISGFGGEGGSPNPKPNIGGCSSGACPTPNRPYVAGEDTGAQTRAVASLGALRSKVGVELHPFLDAAVTAVRTNGTIDLDAVPLVPGTEPIRSCLQTYNHERALASA